MSLADKVRLLHMQIVASGLPFGSQDWSAVMSPKTLGDLIQEVGLDGIHCEYPSGPLSFNGFRLETDASVPDETMLARLVVPLD